MVDDVRSGDGACDVAGAAGAIYRTCDGDVSDARNLGASIAKGEYFLFLDADQFLWSPDAVGELLEHLKTDQPDIATGPIMQSWGARNGWSDLREVYRTVVPTLSGGYTLIRRAAFERLGGFRTRATSLFTWEDVDLDLRARLAGYKIRMLPFHLVHRRPFNFRLPDGTLL